MPQRLSSLMRAPAPWIALAAALAACTGLAVAATSSSSSVIHGCVNKKTRVLRIATRCRRHRESSISWNKEGPRGVRGLKGSTGSIGKAGPTGAQGPQGAQGVPGPVFAELPSGRTERGWFVASGDPTASGQSVGAAISFSFQLPSTPTVSSVDIGGSATTDCPGSLSSPQAAPGKLCLYIARRENVVTTGPFVFGIDAQGSSGEDGTANRFGAQLYAQSAEKGPAAVTGTYAVTAP